MTRRTPQPSRRAFRALALASALVALGVMSGCDPEAPAPDGETVRLLLDDAPPPAGPPTTFANSGSGTVTVSVATRDGGALESLPSGGADRDIRLPAHDPTEPAPRAVIRVVDEAGADDLDPGTEPFEFGADFLLDAVSQGGSGTIDNGNNLLQRGLWNNVSQYKIQLDGGRPSCRVKGAAGAVAVSSPAVEPDRWYRVRCRRNASTVTIEVTSWDADGVPTTISRSNTGASGSMTPSDQSVPLSAGGKLNANGEVAGSSDQFNGMIDNVGLRLG